MMKHVTAMIVTSFLGLVCLASLFAPVSSPGATGLRVDYSTYLGGNNYDVGEDLAVDSSGCAYVTGTTRLNDFPTWNPYQSTATPGGYFGDNVFITKFSSTGSLIVYSTYLGGNDDDEGHGIAVDSEECAYVTGVTLSFDFPTYNPYQSSSAGWIIDAFVTKLSSSGTSLIYSTYLGGGFRRSRGGRDCRRLRSLRVHCRLYRIF